MFSCSWLRSLFSGVEKLENKVNEREVKQILASPVAQTVLVNNCKPLRFPS